MSPFWKPIDTCSHKRGDRASGSARARQEAELVRRRNLVPLPDQGCPTRRLPSPHERPATWQHSHVARPVQAHRHQPGIHARTRLRRMWVIASDAGRIQSSRRLSTEAGRNLEVMWLLRGLRPDFRTIANFRSENRDASKPVFRAFVMLCRRLDLFGRELLAVDSTRLKAVNSRRRNYSIRQKLADWIKQADERIDEYLTHLDRADQTEAQADGGAMRAANLQAYQKASSSVLTCCGSSSITDVPTSASAGRSAGPRQCGGWCRRCRGR